MTGLNWCVPQGKVAETAAMFVEGYELIDESSVLP